MLDAGCSRVGRFALPVLLLVGLPGCLLANPFPPLGTLCLNPEEPREGGQECRCDADCITGVCNQDPPVGDVPICGFCFNAVQASAPGEVCGCGVDCMTGACEGVCCLDGDGGLGQGEACACNVDCSSGQCVDDQCCAGPAVVAGAECIAGCQCTSTRCVEGLCCAGDTELRPPGATCGSGCECELDICAGGFCCTPGGLPSGQACDASCDCESKRCEGGACCRSAVDEPAGTPCLCGAECLTGVCEDGVCCGTGVDLQAGARCGCDRECALGLCGDGVCCADETRIAQGEACDEACDCGTGFCTDEGRCCQELQLADGAFCACDQECTSGVCDERCCLDGAADREDLEACACDQDCASGWCSPEGVCSAPPSCMTYSVIVREFPIAAPVANAEACTFEEDGDLGACLVSGPDGGIGGLCTIVGEEGLLVRAAGLTDTLFMNPFTGAIFPFSEAGTANVLAATGIEWPEDGIGYATVFNPGTALTAIVPEGYSVFYTDGNGVVIASRTQTRGLSNIVVVGPARERITIQLQGLDGRVCRDGDNDNARPYDGWGMVAEDRISLPMLDGGETFIDIVCE
ncbi:MAG: hypothetical protein ACFCGT_15655 [Sandaracinaceae bacterium]